MAARILALLIPLAITLPQLETSRPTAPVAQHADAADAAGAASAAASSRETRQGPDAAVTRVSLESRVHEAMSAIDAPTAVVGNAPALTTGRTEGATQAPVADMAPQVRISENTPPVRKAPLRRAAPKSRAVSSDKVAGALAGGPATRKAIAIATDRGCAPSLHCAPVVVAKITPVPVPVPVTRRPL